MKVRFMRIVVFFDLPVVTKKEVHQYTKFRKYLISQGFVMVQKSVYSKIALNGSSAGTVVDNLKKNRPSSGVVQVLTVTEKQYQNIEFLVGESQNETVDSQQRLVVL